MGLERRADIYMSIADFQFGSQRAWAVEWGIGEILEVTDILKKNLGLKDPIRDQVILG